MKNNRVDLAGAGEMVAFPGERYRRQRRELATTISGGVLAQIGAASARVERRLVILGVDDADAKRQASAFERAAFREVMQQLVGFAVGDTAGGAA